VTEHARVALAFVLGVLLTVGVTKVFSGPSNYDDCVLKELKGTQPISDAAAVIVGACRRKFPDKEHREEERSLGGDLQEMNPFLLGSLTGRAGLEYGSIYAGDLYNGTKDFTITEVEIEVSAITRRDTASRTYRTKVLAPPLGTGHFSFTIILGDPGSTYAWSITGARGYSERITRTQADTSAKGAPQQYSVSRAAFCRMLGLVQDSFVSWRDNKSGRAYFLYRCK